MSRRSIRWEQFVWTEEKSHLHLPFVFRPTIGDGHDGVLMHQSCPTYCGVAQITPVGFEDVRLHQVSARRGGCGQRGQES